MTMDGTRQRILVVDDEHALVSTLAAILELHGMKSLKHTAEKKQFN
jgi:DNA-binding response OmpR family regulator